MKIKGLIVLIILIGFMYFLIRGGQEYKDGEHFGMSYVHILTTTEEVLAEEVSLEESLDNALEEKELLIQYVNDLKEGRISIDVDIDQHINKQIDDAINKWSQHHNVEVALIRAVINRESNFNPTVISVAGAMGLMQIMPATARDLGLDNPWDISDNIEAGTRHLAWLLKYYNNNYSNALAAYNAGHGNVDSWLRDPRYGVNGQLKHIPFPETRAYVPYVLKYYNIYKSQK